MPVMNDSEVKAYRHHISKLTQKELVDLAVDMRQQVERLDSLCGQHQTRARKMTESRDRWRVRFDKLLDSLGRP